jgi:DNA repair exonuclease SbcCD nuclease subunit
MIRILHTGDLHLSLAEEAYSLTVLDEIFDLAREHDVSHLLLCGDIFDSFEDLEGLRKVFRRRVNELDCEVLLLPGNHEALRRGSGELGALDLGAVVLLDREPYSFIQRPEVDFLAIPHQAAYSGYGDWKLPQKNGGTRIALAHATVIGTSFSGPREETGASAIDPDLFNRCGIDYAAMGHIHDRRLTQEGSTTVGYPGSARVWRRGETGARGLYLLELEQGVQPSFIALKTAGQYREYQAILSLDGQSRDFNGEAASWDGADWIRIRFSGLVEDERAVAALEARLRADYKSRVRRFEIDREEVSVLPGIASQPLAQRFLSLWGNREPAGGEERRVWLRARAMGLEEIKRIMEARS